LLMLQSFKPHFCHIYFLISINLLCINRINHQKPYKFRTHFSIRSVHFI
jgi:hypothetical protein